MGLMQRVIKPKTKRAKRMLEEKGPKIIENTKKCLFINAKKVGPDMRQCMKDIYRLKRGNSKLLEKDQQLVRQFLPFEDILPFERFAHMNDTSLFAFASHSKKRPNNLVLGRMYDHHILDIVEFGVNNFMGLEEFENSKISVDTKPCLVFCGSEFEDLSDFKRVKSLLIDFFRGVEATDVSLQGFEHALLFTSSDNTIYMRSYKILLKKSGTRIPRVELEEIGPSLDLTIRRTKFASPDLMKRACRRPAQLIPKKVKNVSKDVFGSKLGRIHMTKQDLNKLQTRKVKALKKGRQERANADEDSAPVQEEETSENAESMEVSQE